MGVHVITVDSNNLTSFDSKIATFFHIIQVNFFVFKNIHDKIHQLESFFSGFRVVNNTGSNNIHSLNITQFAVQIIRMNKDFPQKVSKFLVFKSGMTWKSTRNIFLNLFESFNFISTQMRQVIHICKGHYFIICCSIRNVSFILPNILPTKIEKFIAINIFHQTFFFQVYVTIYDL